MKASRFSWGVVVGRPRSGPGAQGTEHLDEAQGGLGLGGGQGFLQAGQGIGGEHRRVAGVPGQGRKAHDALRHGHAAHGFMGAVVHDDVN